MGQASGGHVRDAPVIDPGAGDGGRTRTPLSGNRILSPVRMPVSPLLHGES